MSKPPISPEIKFNSSKFNKSNFQTHKIGSSNIRKLAFVDNTTQENNIRLSKINLSQPSNYNSSKIADGVDSEYSSQSLEHNENIND